MDLAAIWLVPRRIEQLGELVAALPGWLAQAEVESIDWKPGPASRGHPHRLRQPQQ
ncbi:MAG: hypothetical protein WBN89_15990 [Prochlorococcaceae cyanobacterium]